MLPLLPTVTFAASWGAIALGTALSRGDWARVALLGRVMSVPCFALAIGHIVLSGVTALLGSWSLHTAACLLGGAAALAFSGYSYRFAQRADSWEQSSLSLFQLRPGRIYSACRIALPTRSCTTCGQTVLRMVR